jgi:N-acetylglutamate synthase-like GNAT family acetyltransferase
MTDATFRIRRATVDDLSTLKSLWESMRIPLGDLERRLTEFQVAEGPDGKVVGAVGFQIIQRHGLIHSEAFSDFSATDQVRPMFWTRISALALNHGVARLWTRENAPFWSQNGLQPPASETLARLPEAWDRNAPGLLTLRLKDEDAIANADKEIEMLMATERQRTSEAIGATKKFRTAVIWLGTLFALGLLALAVWLVFRNRINPLAPQ